MVISRTPYRISFFGGGTDYPTWYEEHGGSVLATSIGYYCYISCRYLPQFFDHKHRIVYSKIESVKEIDEIIHPAVREGLRFMDTERGMEIHHDGDLPKQTGLGTSSSFAVGLLNALYSLRGEMVSPMQLAKEAIHVERNMCGDTVGSQDQITAAHGGLNRIDFAEGDNFVVHPLTLSADRMAEFESSIMMFFTGFSRMATDIASHQVKNIPKKSGELAKLAEMVDEGIKILTSGDLTDFGRLLHEGWQIKRSLSTRISSEGLDEIYDKAMAAGATGGKLCGAGGGGFFVFHVDQDKQDSVRKALSGYLEVPFVLDRTGSEIIFYDPEP